MNKEAIFHSMDSEYAYPISNDTMVIKLRAKKDDIKKCYLFYGDRFSSEENLKIKSVNMKKYSTDEYYDYFIAKFKSEYNRLFYYFKISNDDNEFYYYDDKCHKEADTERVRYYSYPYIRDKDIVKTPKWVKDAVIYQIFPDSFASAHKKLKLNNSSVMQNGICYERNLGGTIRGIIENIDYLIELGVNCVYLNPIFKANSYHKYDTVDYFEIDPCFGDKNDFRELVDKLHKNGIRVILDGVFNHTSSDFFAFRDIIKNGKGSKYKDWYIIYEYPVNPKKQITYETFAYVANMPRLNTANNEVMEYILDVGKYWVKEFDIDGWRLDVADEIDHNFWRKFRNEVKKLKSEAYIVGEIWGRCNSFLNGDQFDAVMNYNFTNSVVDYFAKGIMTAEELKNKLESMKVMYKEPIYDAMMNLIDSHDTNRFLYYCDTVEKLKLATFFQFTYTGAPSIYYGDELGLNGEKAKGDEELRKAMPWNKLTHDNELFNHYKKLINIRKENIALRRGDLRVVDYNNDNNFISFLRKFENEKVLILINNGDKNVNIELPQGYEQIYDLYNDVPVSGESIEVKGKKGYILNLK